MWLADVREKVHTQFLFNPSGMIFRGDSSGALTVESGEESLGKQLPRLSAFHLPYPSGLYHGATPEPR